MLQSREQRETPILPPTEGPNFTVIAICVDISEEGPPTQMSLRINNYGVANGFSLPSALASGGLKAKYSAGFVVWTLEYAALVHAHGFYLGKKRKKSRLIEVKGYSPLR